VQPSSPAWQESSGRVQPSSPAWQESSGPVQSPAQPAWGSSGPQEAAPQPAPDPFDLYEPVHRPEGLQGQQAPGQQAPGPLEVQPPTQVAASPYAQQSPAQQSPDAFNWQPDPTPGSSASSSQYASAAPPYIPDGPSTSAPPASFSPPLPPGPSPAPATPYAQPDPGGQAPWGAPQAPFGQQAGLDPQYQSGAAQSAAYPGAAAPPAWTSGQAGGSWSAVVSADRTYYDIVRRASGAGAQGIDFPVYAAERRFSLVGAQMRIGRHSASRGLYPEIDLTGPPTDPGVSRLHAVLIARPDGGWAVLDPGSANGTMVNGSEIPANQQVPLRDGDRINLGAWTAITVQHA
jgi:hypothetical protein